MGASRPPGDALARRRQSGTGTAPAAGVTQTSGSGGLRPIRGSPRIWDHPRLIRPPCTTTGLPLKAGSGSGEGRTRPTGEGRKLDPGRVPDPETRTPTRTERFRLETPCGTPGDWHPKNNVSRPWRPAPPLFDIGKTFARERPGTSARPRGFCESCGRKVDAASGHARLASQLAQQPTDGYASRRYEDSSHGAL